MSNFRVFRQEMLLALSPSPPRCNTGTYNLGASLDRTLLSTFSPCTHVKVWWRDAILVVYAMENLIKFNQTIQLANFLLNL